MTLWIDAMLSPTLARWITTEFDGVEAASVEHLDLRHASDATIFDAAREANAVVLTKDSDYVDAVQRRGPPPAVIWVRAGNTSTKAMKRLPLRSVASSARSTSSWRACRRAERRLTRYGSRQLNGPEHPRP